jgi:hypothetical protein
MSDNEWKNTTELEEYGIGKRLAYSWFDSLEAQGHARRSPGGKSGFLLFNSDGVAFLKGRVKKTGKPPREPTEAEMARLSMLWQTGESITAIAEKLNITFKLTRRWIEECMPQPEPTTATEEGDIEKSACCG